MKIFRSVQKSFKFVGIYAENVKKHKDPYDRKTLIVFCIFLLNPILNLVYFSHVANNSMKILQSGFLIISSVYDFTFYTLIIWNIMEWIQLIDRLEKLINESKEISKVLIKFVN